MAAKFPQTMSWWETLHLVTWWKGLGSLQSRLARMLHHEYDALKGYRFLGGAISLYSVSCMPNVIFNPSLLNWSSLILTVAHIFINFFLFHHLQPPNQATSRLSSHKKPRFSWREIDAQGFGRIKFDGLSEIFHGILRPWWCAKRVTPSIWVFPKMVGFPNKPMGFPTKNDHFDSFWGVLGVPPFEETTITETNIAMENPPFLMVFPPVKMGIFMGYVSLLEGMYWRLLVSTSNFWGVVYIKKKSVIKS